MNASKLLTWLVFGLLALGAAVAVVLGTASPGPGGRPGAASQTVLTMVIFAIWVGPTVLFGALVAWLARRPIAAATRALHVLLLCLGVWVLFGLAEFGAFGAPQAIFVWGFIFLLPAASLTALVALFAGLLALRRQSRERRET